MMFSNVVLGIPKDRFEELIDAAKKSRGVEKRLRARRRDVEASSSPSSRRSSASARSATFRRTSTSSCAARSRRSSIRGTRKRAVDYRRFNKIPDDWGTAVNVMEMVFGNMGEDSGTGVAFTRDPNTGEKMLFGEYLQQRARRGRGRRHPHTREDRRPGAPPARRSTRSSRRSRRGSSDTTATCKTSSSRSSAGSCSCCRRAAPSAAPRPR